MEIVLMTQNFYETQLNPFFSLKWVIYNWFTIFFNLQFVCNFWVTGIKIDHKEQTQIKSLENSQQQKNEFFNKEERKKEKIQIKKSRIPKPLNP